MVKWSRLFGWDDRDVGSRIRDDFEEPLLPYNRDDVASVIPAKEVTRVALRLKHQIEQVIPCELPEERITSAHSSILTPGVVKTAVTAGKIHAPGSSTSGSDPDYSACVVYCLLGFIITYGKETTPENVIERATDIHALTVIGSSGYQKCISYLWRGWLIQDEEDPNRFVEYKNKASTSYWTHFDADRMRTPQYQNMVQVAFSLIFLALYTGAINTINREGDLDVVEGLLYIFTLGFICDEFAKFWKVGRHYLGFWNVFNSTLYALLTISFITRMIALGSAAGDAKRYHWNVISYNWLAFSAPMFWARLLLYLDGYRFFGAMLVVLKVMMKESLIFFALLVVVWIGFLQAFIGMDLSDDNAITAGSFIFQSMINAMMGAAEFDGFDRFAPPFGLILYYIYNFIVVVILLNVLVALYNSAYEDVTDNAIDEYLALFATKTMQFVRAPDENVFIPPFNLIELFLLILPVEWWMPRHYYQRLNDYVMGVIYSPVLLVTAYLEVKTAYLVKGNRRRGQEDEDTTQEWEQLADEIDFEGEGWTKRVDATKPNVEFDATLLEVRELQKQVKELHEMMGRMSREGTPAAANGH